MGSINKGKTMYRIMFVWVCLIGSFLSVTAQAGSRVETVKARGEVKVCIWPGYFAISYRNPRTKELEGIDIDMAREFAKFLGVKLTFVDSSFGKLKENMTNDACDISMHGVGVREDRKPFMDFSEPHLISG